MPSIETLWLIFVISGFTVGFGHCSGMCGPIVVALSLNLKGQSVAAPHLLYHAGRVTTYALLGGIMGAIGSFTSVTSSISTIQKGMMIFAGALIVVMGLAMTGWLPLGRIFPDHYNPRSIIVRGFRSLMRRHSMQAYFPLGLLLGLLPCGPVYTALLSAAREGMEASTLLKGAAAGMGLMLAFGLGTFPALFLIARLTSIRWIRSRQFIYRVGAVLMIIVGGYYVAKGIRY